MTDTQTLIAQAYAAFNHRDIDSALALMSDTVSWPKASEGGRVVGKAEICAYWIRQWQEFDPHVEPHEVTDQPDGTTSVRVHQLVKSLAGEVLSDSEVCHVYTITNGLIERMDLKQSIPEGNLRFVLCLPPPRKIETVALKGRDFSPAIPLQPYKVASATEATI